MVPMPAVAIYCKIGHPNPPAPITKILAFEFALPQITYFWYHHLSVVVENPE
jgi:hypothetical protein